MLNARYVDQKTLWFPQIARVTRQFTVDPVAISTDRAIVIVAADDCDVLVRHIEQFSYGVYLDPAVGGSNVAYNTFGHIVIFNCAIGLQLGDAAKRAANANTFSGGHIKLTGLGGSIPYAGFRKIVCYGNGNTFSGVTLEGTGEEYVVAMFDAYNTFVGCHWESTNNVLLDGTAARANVFVGGFTVESLGFTYANSAPLNEQVVIGAGTYHGGAVQAFDGTLIMRDDIAKARIVIQTNTNGDIEFRKQDGSAVGLRWDETGDRIIVTDFEINGALNHDGSTIGFYGATLATKPTVTGARDDGTALADLLTELETLGLITDSSTVS